MRNTARLYQAMLASEDSIEFMLARFPRLVRRMKWVAILSLTEAGAALRDYLMGRDDDRFARCELTRYGGGEAVCHFGGPARVIARAIAVRHDID